MSEKELFGVSKTSSRGTSIRITIPKEVVEELSIGDSQFIGFYRENGRFYIRKIE